MFEAPPTMVTLVRARAGAWDVLALRTRMTLGASMTLVAALALCHRKGWIISETDNGVPWAQGTIK
jgi:hypothetical protein